MTQDRGGLAAALASEAGSLPDVWEAGHWGVTRGTQGIPALLHRDAYMPESSSMRVLLLSGFSGDDEDVSLAMRALELYRAAGPAVGDIVALSAAPCVNPGGNGDQSLGFPPGENFFFDPEQPESRYLWRWVCFQAP